MKLAIITTHPIQYYAPVFKLLHQRKNIEINVFYTLGKGADKTHDPGFNKTVSWDIPLLEGYPYEWANNVSKTPGTRSFKGIVTPELISQIETWQPDAILIFGWAYNSHLKLIRHFSKKIPTLFRGDSTLLAEPRGIKKSLKTLFLKWVYSHIDHAFYVGKNNKAYFLKYGLKENQLSFAPHAVDNTRFEEQQTAEVNKLRASFKLTQQDVLVLFAGKFEPVKNVALLLSAFIKLNKPHVHLLLVGNGIQEQVLKEQAAKSNLANKIHFLDFKNQTYMPVLYQAADLFCLPSKSETWGLSINEAMACEKAILASDKVGCAVNLILPGENGSIFSEGDENSLIAYLQQLTNNKELLIRFGKLSRKIIEDWNFTNIAIAIENKLLNK